ncbi:hypothetical protein BJ875DRAFT_342473, partial [Amylocarpus encephaloides]
TVEAIQTRALVMSSLNRDFVVSAMKSGLLFPKITARATRRRLKTSLLSIKYLILTIKTLHENMKYLTVGVNLIKTLFFTGNIRTIVYHSLRNIWKARKTTCIQIAEEVFYVLP